MSFLTPDDAAILRLVEDSLRLLFGASCQLPRRVVQAPAKGCQMRSALDVLS
jgi:hypothetical protein